ncbi:MAG: hypothetical protein IKP88_13805 [Lachnospiraceae bacterium]|nr:hypothetical protein [Lachnospiraceae bacterium]
MFNGLKIAVGGMMVAGLVSVAGAFGTKASDNTLIADLDGNGTEEIVTYYEDINPLEGGDINYSFKMTVNGETAYEEGGLIERYPEVTEGNRLHDKLDHLNNIEVSVVDVNPANEQKEIVAKYYASVDNILLGMKVFRYNDGKLNAVSEFYPEAAHAYIPSAQANNKYIKVSVEEYLPALGKIWVNRNYKITKNGFVEKTSKSGILTVAPATYEENKMTKFKAATYIEVFANKYCNVEDSIGCIGEGEKFTVKKIIYPDNENFYVMRAYIKTASGLKGWIWIDNTVDEMGQPINPVAAGLVK